MEGHFIEGYGDRTAKSELRLLADAEKSARAFLADGPAADERAHRISQLIEGFESPFDLSCSQRCTGPPCARAHEARTRQPRSSPSGLPASAKCSASGRSRSPGNAYIAKAGSTMLWHR